MLKNAFILTFRKLKTHLFTGTILLFGLSVGYAWLVTSLYNQTLSGVIGSLVIIIASSLNSRSILSKREFALYKIFGAHKKNIWRYLVTQSLIITGLVTLLGLTILDIISHQIVINLHSLLITQTYWLFVASSLTITAIILTVYFHIFSKSKASIS